VTVNHVHVTVVSVPGFKRPAVLTKWSEVRDAQSRLVVTTPDGKQHPAQVVGVYPEHDLALLSVLTSGTRLVPLDLSHSTTPELGDFIVMARPDGRVEGFGVVSVKTRSLRESDRAYLGVLMDFTSAGKNGVPLQRVMPDSAAARAGLRGGDVIVSVDQTPIVGAVQMRNMLQRLVPGSTIKINYRRGSAERTATVHLGSRADSKDIRRVPRKRMERMERMGTVPSRVRTNFPSVIQSDMPIETYDAGAPVTDLKGNVIGIAIARGSRIKTYIIPTATIRKLLATKPVALNDAMASRNNIPNFPGNSAPRGWRSYPRHTPPRAIPVEDDDPLGKVRRLLGEIERNNNENAEILRRIKDALRGLEHNTRRGSNNRAQP